MLNEDAILKKLDEITVRLVAIEGLLGAPIVNLKKIEILNTPIADFELNARTHNAIFWHVEVEGCPASRKTKVIDLIKTTESEMLRIYNFGRKSLREVRELLQTMGLKFGMSEADIQAFISS